VFIRSVVKVVKRSASCPSPLRPRERDRPGTGQHSRVQPAEAGSARAVLLRTRQLRRHHSRAVATAIVRPAAVLGPLGHVSTSNGHRAGPSVAGGPAVAAPIDIARYAYAVAGALHAAGLAAVGAEAVRVEIEPDGEYRLQLDGVDTTTSAVFAGALDDLVSTVADPRYLVPRYLLGTKPAWSPESAGWRLLLTRKLGPDGVVWHAVPTALGVRRELVDAFVTGWNSWVSGGSAVFTGNPDGAECSRRAGDSHHWTSKRSFDPPGADGPRGNDGLSHEDPGRVVCRC